MVDCRLCRNHYSIYKCESEMDKKIIVCLNKQTIIDWEYVTDGPCEDYVDVDSDLS